MKRSSRVLLWILATLPLVVTLAVFPFFPDSIPAHYNLAGEIDRWGSRYELLLFPALGLLLALGDLLLARYVRGKNPANEKPVLLVGICVFAMYNVLCFFQLYQAYQQTAGRGSLPEVDTMQFVGIVLSLLFILLGNLLPKCKQNTALGIRVKWTLESGEVWYHTHRFGGKLMVVSGFASLLLCAFWLKGLAAMAVVISLLLVETAVDCVYAYRLYRKLEEK